MSNKVKAERRDGYVFVTTRTGHEYTLNEDTAEDLRLALQQLAYRDVVVKEIDKYPDSFDFTGDMKRDEFIDYVMECYDGSITLAEEETICENVHACAEFVGIAL